MLNSEDKIMTLVLVLLGVLVAGATIIITVYKCISSRNELRQLEHEQQSLQIKFQKRNTADLELLGNIETLQAQILIDMQRVDRIEKAIGQLPSTDLRIAPSRHEAHELGVAQIKTHNRVETRNIKHIVDRKLIEETAVLEQAVDALSTAVARI